MKETRDDGARQLEKLQDMLKDEHSEKMNAMKKLIEQQLQDEHSGILASHSAAHAARAREIEELWRSEMYENKTLHSEKLFEMESMMRKNRYDGEKRTKQLQDMLRAKDERSK